MELCAQRATLQQQRSHIEILESALTNAQLHIGNLQDEVSAHSSLHPLAESIHSNFYEINSIHSFKYF